MIFLDILSVSSGVIFIKTTSNVNEVNMGEITENKSKILELWTQSKQSLPHKENRIGNIAVVWFIKHN